MCAVMILLVMAGCGGAAMRPIPMSAVQEKIAAVVAVSPFIGKWKGTWESSGYSFVYGDMDIEIFSHDGERLIGKVKVTYARVGSTCANGWEALSGVVQKSQKIYLYYNLGGHCGNVALDLTLDMQKGDLLSGSYVNENPASGKIRLKKQ